MSKYFTITILVVLLALLVFPQIVFAQVDCSKGIVPCGRDCNNNGKIDDAEKCNLCDVFKLLQAISNGVGIFALGWAGLFIVIGGITILTSAGSANRASQGKRMITFALMGVVLIFFAWIIINTVMNELVNPSAMPWPWNKIKCTPTQGGGNPPAGGNVICCADFDTGNYLCAPDTFATEADCNAECKDEWLGHMGLLRWCCRSSPGPCGEAPLKTYCVCKVPVYATMARTIQLFTEIKGTDLGTAENCTSACVTSNASTYCPDRKTANNPNLSCANQTDLQAIETFCAKLQATTDSITGACFTNSNACYDAASSNSDYIKKCWLDDYLYCSCTAGLATWCTSTKPSGLYRTSKQVGVGGLYNAWDCVRSCSYSGGYCRTGSLEDGATGGITVGTCTGVNCSDATVNICGKTSNNCSTSQVNNWNTQIQAAASGRSICSGINTVKIVKAIMARESGGDISRISADGKSAGLMQLTPETANNFKGNCGVSANIDFNWLTNSANAQAQICIAIEFLKSLTSACGCNVRQLAAGYNGGGKGTGACGQSTNCGSCLICSGEPFTRRWECLWDDDQHTICNADRATGSFEATRRYVPQVNYCYSQF